jgi:hypothetical protein
VERCANSLFSLVKDLADVAVGCRAVRWRAVISLRERRFASIPDVGVTREQRARRCS